MKHLTRPDEPPLVCSAPPEDADHDRIPADDAGGRIPEASESLFGFGPDIPQLRRLHLALRLLVLFTLTLVVIVWWQLLRELP